MTYEEELLSQLAALIRPKAIKVEHDSSKCFSDLELGSVVQKLTG